MATMSKNEWIERMVLLIHILIAARKKRDWKRFWAAFDGLVRATKYVGSLQENPQEELVSSCVEQHVERVLRQQELAALEPNFGAAVKDLTKAQEEAGARRQSARGKKHTPNIILKDKENNKE